MFREDPRYLQFNNRRLMQLFLPLLLEQVIIVGVSFIDAVMLSSIHEGAYAAISLVDMINLLIMQLFMAIGAGGSIVAAQYLGKRDRSGANKVATQTVALVSAVALIIAAVTLALNHAMLRLIYPKVSGSIMGYATLFLALSAISYPFYALFYCGSSLLYAQANSRSSMVASLAMNAVKVGLNLLFILVFRWGVLGVGLATILSRLTGAAIVTRFLLRKDAPLYFDRTMKFKELLKTDRRVFQVALPSGTENFLFNFGKLLIGTLIAGLSAAHIAANAASNTLSTVINVPGNALNLATVTVVGQCVGAGLIAEAEYNAKRLLKFHFLAQGITGTLMFLFARPMTGLLNLSPEATDIAVGILMLYGPLSFLFEPTAFGLPNSLRAAGDNQYVMYGSIVSMLVFRIGFSFLLVKAFGLQLPGIWYAMYLDWIIRSLLFVRRFRSGQWKTHRLV